MVSFPPTGGGAAPETGGPAPFYIYSGEDEIADLAPIKAAKASMPDLPPIRPVRVTLGNRERLGLDLDSRVLCVGQRLPWAGNYALITEKTTPENVAVAVRWVIEGGDDPRATTVEDWLNHYLGPGVREVTPEELEGERRLRAYVNGEE